MIEYSGNDKNVVNRIQMILENPENIAGGYEGLEQFLGRPFPFQFPPRIRSDSKSINWEEQNLWSYEPLAYWQGAGARNLQIEAKYVVDGNEWTGAKILAISHAAKSYAYRQSAGAFNSTNLGPIIRLNDIYDIVGKVDKGTTWRATNISVSYSDVLVTDKIGTGLKPNDLPGGWRSLLPNLGGGSSSDFTLALDNNGNFINPIGYSNELYDQEGVNSYPLITTITFDLMSYTRISSGIGGQSVDSLSGAGTLIQGQNMASAPNSKWY